MIFLADKDRNVSFIDFSSVKSRRVVRSILGAETFALADACDATIVIQHEHKKTY